MSNNRCLVNAAVRGTSIAFKNPVYIALSYRSPNLTLVKRMGVDDIIEDDDDDDAASETQKSEDEANDSEVSIITSLRPTS